MGPPVKPAACRSAGTRDGKGIVFVSPSGIVHPAGFSPAALGSVRLMGLVDICTGTIPCSVRSGVPTSEADAESVPSKTSVEDRGRGLSHLRATHWVRIQDAPLIR